VALCLQILALAVGIVVLFAGIRPAVDRAKRLSPYFYRNWEEWFQLPTSRRFFRLYATFRQQFFGSQPAERTKLLETFLHDLKQRRLEFGPQHLVDAVEAELSKSPAVKPSSALEQVLRVDQVFISSDLIPEKSAENLQHLLKLEQQSERSILLSSLIWSIAATGFLWVVYFLFVGYDLREITFHEFRSVGLCYSAVTVVTIWTTIYVCRRQSAFGRAVKRPPQSVSKSSSGSSAAFSHRNTILIIAHATDPISLLSLLPCSLLFMQFVAHLRAIDGAPVTWLHWAIWLVCLSVLFLSANYLTSRAKAGRSLAVRDYELEGIRVQRLLTRVKAIVVDNAPPLQDDPTDTVEKINQIAMQNHTVQMETDPFRVTADHLNDPATREKIQQYLEAIVSRNREITRFLGSLQSGARAPFAMSPLFRALLVPVAGAGGLTLFDFILRFIR